MIKRLLNKLNIGSLCRSVIYTLGHIVIATICNVYITGAVVKLAITDALIEPMINMIWYYILDSLWVRYMNKDKKH